MKENEEMTLSHSFVLCSFLMFLMPNTLTVLNFLSLLQFPHFHILIRTQYFNVKDSLPFSFFFFADTFYVYEAQNLIILLQINDY